MKNIILLSTFFLFLFNSCNKNETSSKIDLYEHVLEIGQYNLALQEFNERVDKANNYHDNEGNSRKNFKLAWDASIRIGLIIADAYANKLDTIVKTDYLEIRDILLNILSLPSNNIYMKINKSTIEEVWSRRNRFYKIGHITLNVTDKDKIADLKNRIENDNMYFEKLIADYNYIDNFPFIKNLNLYNITGGDLLPAIEKKVYDMNIGEIISVTTKNHVHLIRLFGILERKQEPLNITNSEMIKNKIAKNITYEEKHSELNIDILCKEKFIDDVLKNDDEVIAKINGKDITLKEIKSLHKSVLNEFNQFNSEFRNHKTFNKIEFLLKYNEIKKNGNMNKLIGDIKKLYEQYMFLEYYKRNVSTREPAKQMTYEDEKLNENQINRINEAKLNYILDGLKEKYEITVNDKLLEKAGYPIQSIEIKNL